MRRTPARDVARPAKGCCRRRTGSLEFEFERSTRLSARSARYRPAPFQFDVQRAAYSEVSLIMLRPDGAHLFVRRELASRNFSVGLGEVCILLRGQLNDGPILRRQLQQKTGEGVLRLRGESAD